MRKVCQVHRLRMETFKAVLKLSRNYVYWSKNPEEEKQGRVQVKEGGWDPLGVNEELGKRGPCASLGPSVTAQPTLG